MTMLVEICLGLMLLGAKHTEVAVPWALLPVGRGFSPISTSFMKELLTSGAGQLLIFWKVRCRVN